MEPLVLDRYDERTSTHGLLVAVQRPVAGVLRATPLTTVFVVSASSCLPEEEELLWLRKTEVKLDRRTRPDGEEGEVAWEDPFSKEGLVEYRNIAGGEW